MSGSVTVEPDLTPRQLIDRAAVLRPLLREQRGLTEARSYPTDEIHEACLEAGIYRLYVPRRYGGLEFDPVTYMRVCIELARGDMSAGWCVALAAAHALQVASWWPERAQAEIFGGDFRCASVGRAQRIDGGWELTGRVAYCSGPPRSTHYLGQALIAGADGDPTERLLLFVAARDQFLMVGYDVSRGTVGASLHGNSLYGGRAMGVFTLTLAALAVGAARQALDEYESMLDTKMSVMPPYVPRRMDASFQRWFGLAMAKSRASRLARVYRDLSMLDSHRNMLMREWAYGEIAREQLGLPRAGPGNVQTAHPGRAAAGRL